MRNPSNKSKVRYCMSYALCAYNYYFNLSVNLERFVNRLNIIYNRMKGLS